MSKFHANNWFGIYECSRTLFVLFTAMRFHSFGFFKYFMYKGFLEYYMYLECVLHLATYYSVQNATSWRKRSYWGLQRVLKFKNKFCKFDCLAFLFRELSLFRGQNVGHFYREGVCKVWCWICEFHRHFVLLQDDFDSPWAELCPRLCYRPACNLKPSYLQSWPKVYDHPDFLQYFVIWQKSEVIK